MTGPGSCTFGGYLPLQGAERPAAALPGNWLASGRACVAAILRHQRPERLFAPHFLCDTATLAAREMGVPIVRYELDPQWAPAAPVARDGKSLFLAVDHFGQCADALRPWVDGWGDHLVLDLTHAFHAEPPAGAWAFNSARKFFGVPDGARWWGPATLPAPQVENTAFRMDHLVLAAMDLQAEGLDAYRANNALMTTAPLAASTITRRILERSDLATAARRRAANFQALHAALKDLNRFPVSVTDAAVLYYPLLVEQDMDKAALHRLGIFAPTLWPEVLQREGVPATERQRSRCLIPLPVDQRYTPDDMNEIAWRIRTQW